MRTIDADALKELFSEVIGHIAKKPEMNGNLEHMIRASAMVIQMIDDAPTVQPDTTTHDSISAKTGGNDEDRTSGDCISRQAMLDGIDKLIKIHFDRTVVLYKVRQVAENLPSVQPETNCSEIPNNSDTISKQAALETIRTMQTYKLFASDDMLLINQAEAQTELMMLPSAEPEIIRCKDCIYQTESWIGIKYCEAHGNHIGKDYDYCSNARRKENGH